MSSIFYATPLNASICLSLLMGLYELLRSKSIPRSSLFKLPDRKKSLPLLPILALPHFLYFFIWTWPETFSHLTAKVSSKHPVDFMLSLVTLCKFIQFTSFFTWYVRSLDISLLSRIRQIFFLETSSLLQLVSGAYLIFIGQLLNWFVWKKLGVAGTCYGFKLGRPIEWVTGFPFDLGLRHPQYVAAVLTICGMALITINKSTAKNGMLAIVAVWTSYYIFTAINEEISDMDKNIS